MPAARALLPGQRWHLQHGPIDLVIGADGPAAAAAHEAAWQRFQTVLDELVAELALLRSPVGPACPLQGRIARRMWQACLPYARPFITPMAAVAGAVAQEVVSCYQRPGITRAYVNNGGDIALHLAPGASLSVGCVADLAQARPDGHFEVHYADAARGIATSGWRGRSLSLGIADSATVLARTAAMADAAATVIANAVDIDDRAIVRRPARDIVDDSDLGERHVTVHVPPLPAARVDLALLQGLRRARALQDEGLVEAVLLSCQGRHAALAPRMAIA